MPAAFVLASASPRRRELLAQIGIVPTLVLGPDIDETPGRDEAPRDYVRRIARAKAQAGIERALEAPELAAGTAFALLACDTTVAVGRRILGKPRDRDDAGRMIDLLSGRRHHVLSSVVLRRPDGGLAERLVDSAVTFARLSGAQRDAALESGEWNGKAGGYAIQGAAASLIRFLSGSYSNVVGLPLFETAQLLRGANLLA
jgi:septum formation protein